MRQITILPQTQKTMVEWTIPITQPRGGGEFFVTFLSFSRGYQISKMIAVADETTGNRVLVLLRYDYL